MSPIEIAGVVISFLGIWLTARRAMLCWPVNFLACAIYFVLFFQVKLYADMVLQALFALAVLYGWFDWARGRASDGEVVVLPLSRIGACAGLCAGAAGAVAIGTFTSRYTDAALPWMDATLSSFSLVAQIWTAWRHRESWALWIVVDVVYVGMFVFKGLYLTAILYAVFVVLAVSGYRRWTQAYNQSYRREL